MEILNSIATPKDIKGLSTAELNSLCAELREFITRTVSDTGGHLAPSLGVVELSVALHYVFDTPKDKMIWDVGHQAYIHKILTGRKDSFHTIRQKNGLSGFPKRSESKHDAFGVGHSSTSISAGLGMAVARDLNKEDFQIISIIGDGALTGGLAFEGINQLGYLQKKMIVVLNDNKMSISMNTGALSNYTKRITKTQLYKDIKTDINSIIKKCNAPELKHLKSELKQLTSPGIVFEKLGLNYIGPIDGHDIEALITALKKADSIDSPAIIHIITTKGKGYKIAEDNASKFHGVGPFRIVDGSSKSGPKNKSYTEIFSDTIVKLAEENKKIAAITAAMPTGTGLVKFSERFPERFFDVGIAEEHAVTFAAALAAEGIRPIVAIYSTFLQRSLDQIIHDVCLQDLPVIFAIDRAGLVGEDGPTHHGTFDLSYLRFIPKMIVSAPKDENELQNLLYTATKTDAPFSIRYPRGSALGVEMDKEFSMIPIGKSETVKKGDDILLIGIGTTVQMCEKAAEELDKQGIKTEVINTRFIKPLDDHIIERILQVKKALVVEENAFLAGLYSAICEKLPHKEVQLESIALPDRFIEHGALKLLREDTGLTAEAIAKKAMDMVKK